MKKQINIKHVLGIFIGLFVFAPVVGVGTALASSLAVSITLSIIAKVYNCKESSLRTANIHSSLESVETFSLVTDTQLQSRDYTDFLHKTYYKTYK